MLSDIVLARRSAISDTQQAWYLQKLFDLCDVDLVIDVGANAGQYIRTLRKGAGYRGHIIAVEPIAEVADKLRNSRPRDKNLDVLKCAVGDQAGDQVFNIMQSSALSSFMSPCREVSDCVARFNNVAEKRQVPVVTIDQIVSQHRFAKSKKAIYLKLDVQGFEAKVLAGMVASKQNIVGVQLETSVVPIYKDVQPYYELMSYMEKNGYALSCVPPTNPLQFPDLVDFDCHYISRDWLVSRGYRHIP